MRPVLLICLNAVCLLALLLLPGCAMEGAASPTPNSVFISITDIKADYPSYAEKLVSVRGYGVIMMAAPLCPGYTGMDTRLSFVDEQNQSIPAVMTASAAGAERSENLREFQGYVRVFSAEIGCPDSLRIETFPYFEIVAIK
jgi:hypothetical protein